MVRIDNIDALTLLRSLDDCSVDSVVSDPPSGISFMGKAWDRHDAYEPQTEKGRDLVRFGSALLAPWEVGFCAFIVDVFSQALRVIKPGGHGLIWALPRTSDLTALGLRVAGWEVRDSVHHLFGSGFPKSADISKAIDKAAGAERVDTGIVTSVTGVRSSRVEKYGNGNGIPAKINTLTAPATPDAKRWSGWGTALKPAHEVWWLVRKPVGGTIAGNVQAWGVGGLNIDGCRVKTSERPEDIYNGQTGPIGGAGAYGGTDKTIHATGHDGGRWPPNVVLTHGAGCGPECVGGCPVMELGAQSGESVSLRSHTSDNRENCGASMFLDGRHGPTNSHNDKGTAARYFPQFRYVAKPSRAEREAGCAHLPARSGAEATGREEGSAGLDNPRAGAGRTSSEIRNFHPTVKSIELMRWLVKLVTPAGGLVLDPFVGSGTTALACVHEGFDFIGSEQSAEYCAIARARVDYADPAGAQARRAEQGVKGPEMDRDGQGRLF